MRRFLFLFIIILSSCAVQVNTMYDQSVDFTQFTKFCWLRGCDYRIEGPEYAQDARMIDYLTASIENELIAKGYVKDEGDPNFMVDFHVVMEEETAYFSQPFDNMDEFEFFGRQAQEQYTFLSGSIVIDIVDHVEGKMIWRGDIVKYLDPNRRVTEEEIQKTVKKALRKFPPK